MRISFLKEILESVYMIEPSQAIAGKQLLNGVLMGLEFAPEKPVQGYLIGNNDFPSIPLTKQIHVANLFGTMYRHDGDCGQIGTQSIANDLLEADAKDEVVGHILMIDSGGGAANSVPVLSKAIRQCTKPVVAFVDGMMASAAMYAGSYCQRIIANDKMDRIGCIGTMVQLADYPRVNKETDGFMRLRIYADGSEEKNGEYEAALEGDFRLIKEQMLNPLNEDFKANIRANRQNVTEDQMKGRTYYASDCVGTLLDAIGDFNSAVAQVMELSNLNINQMNLENIQKIASCSQIESVDGVVSFQEDQVNDINQALASVDEVQNLRTQVSTNLETIENQKSEIQNLNNILAQRDARIKELEAALEATNNKPDTEEHNHNGGTNDGYKEATDEEAMDYCMKVLDGEI